MVELVQAYADFMQTAPFPKLFINADPGSILVGDQREFCRRWPNQQEQQVGPAELRLKPPPRTGEE